MVTGPGGCGSARLCVCVCGPAGLLDAGVGPHTIGTFDRVWDRGGLSAAAAGPGGREGGGEYISVLLTLCNPGARVLAFANEGPAPRHVGVSIDTLRGWVGAVAEAHTVFAVPKALQSGGMQRRVAFSICLSDTTGQVTYRPPSCPCCR